MNATDTFKALASGVIWLQAIVGGLAPLILKDRVRPIVTSVLNMFAGGIFLAGSTMHLLPDAQANKALLDAGCFGGGKCFPLAYLFYAIGFLAVLMVEVFAHAMNRRFSKEKTPQAIDEHTPLVMNVSSTSSQVQPKAEEILMVKPQKHGHTHTHSQSQSTTNDHDMEVNHAHMPGLMTANPALAFIIFAALSFHSIMEGMGIGAANVAAWDILLAIVAHKSLAAFALALELLHHKVPRARLVVTIGLFSLMSPLGIYLGWLLVDGTHETIASGICSAMAGGTFLFVAVMETIPQELKNHAALVPKCGALLAGFFAMGLLSIWT